MKPSSVAPQLLRATVALAAAASLLPLAACGQPAGVSSGGSTVVGAPSGTSGSPGGATASDGAGSGTGYTSTTSEGPVRLQARFGERAPQAAPGTSKPAVQGLAVDYALTNSGPADLLVYDVLPEILGSATLPPHVDPEHAWVLPATGQAGVVRVAKQGFDPAPGVRFMAAPVAGVRVLKPGATTAGRAWVSKPPRAHGPGDSFAGPKGDVSSAAQWQFCVQVVPKAGALRPSPSDPTLFAAPVAAPQEGQLLCTEAVALP